MIWEGLTDELIFLDLDVDNHDDVFRTMGSNLDRLGYCKESYVDALITREKDFPTGINMGEIGIAMPHTDREHVNAEAVSIGVIKNSASFMQMGTTDVPVDAKIIFMLAVKDPDAHLVFLQRIILMLQDQDVLKQILAAQTKQEIIDIIKEKEKEFE